MGNRPPYPPQSERGLSDVLPQTRQAYEKHNKQSAPYGGVAASVYEIKVKKFKKCVKHLFYPLFNLFYFIIAWPYFRASLFS
jgi:hypothetical protein